MSVQLQLQEKFIYYLQLRQSKIILEINFLHTFASSMEKEEEEEEVLLAVILS